MSTRNKTPPLLEPYLRLPNADSQLLLTGVLDASPTWLVTRLLRSVYTPSTSTTSPSSVNPDENVSVILVSWLRDFEFWKGEARRGAGLDLSRLASQNKFAFVDGLTQLFPIDAKSAPTLAAKPVTPVQTTLPTRPIPSRGPVPARQGGLGRPPVQPSAPQITPTAQSPAHPTPGTTPPQPQQQNATVLPSPSLETTFQTILQTITTLTTNNPGSKILLILDSPTTLLSTSPNPQTSPINALLLNLRSNVHSSVLVLEADSPFLDAANSHSEGVPTPLEAAHAAFVVSQAHVSDWVLGLRPLDTGKARDVSGVVRACRGGAWEEGDGDAKELEALYFVQADGGVRVFERGEASVG